MTETKNTDYLHKLLQMNPLEKSSEIVRLHCNFLHPQKHQVKISDLTLDISERRELTIKKLESLRKQIWTLDEIALRQEIEATNVSEFPELAVSLSKIKTITNYRESFRRLKQHPACFEQFFNQFCTLVVASPGDAGELRLSYLKASREATSGHKPCEYRRIARVIQQEFPELEALEKVWLCQIGLESKVRKSPKRFLVLLQITVVLLSLVTMLTMLLFGLIYGGFFKN